MKNELSISESEHYFSCYEIGLKSKCKVSSETHAKLLPMTHYKVKQKVMYFHDTKNKI